MLMNVLLLGAAGSLTVQQFQNHLTEKSRDLGCLSIISHPSLVEGDSGRINSLILTLLLQESFYGQRIRKPLTRDLYAGGL